MNQRWSANVKEAELIAGATQALAQHGLDLHARAKLEPRVQGYQADAILTLGRNKDQEHFVVEAKRVVNTATLGAALAQLDQAERATNLRGVLIAEHIAPPTAERMRELKRQFIDVAGNCYLTLANHYVYVVGRKPNAVADTTGAKTFTPAGLKVLFALICEPHLANATQRTIAGAAGVALGTVPTVLADLRDTGRLLQIRKVQRLNAHKRLLDEWAMGYAQTLRPKTLKAIYKTTRFTTWKTWTLPDGIHWGGEPAATLIAGHLRPGVLTLYGAKPDPKLLVEGQLRPTTAADAEQLVEFRTPFWGKTLQPEGRLDTVPIVLIYADLLAIAEARCMEMAQRLYDDHLARLFPAR